MLTTSPERNDLKSFWNSQFSTQKTNEQIIFDIFFGVVIPICCFTVLGSIRTLPIGIWMAIITSMLALAIWLVSGRWSAFLAGIFFCSFSFAFAIGLLILPLTIIGAGFCPFATSFVYLRNYTRAMQLARRTQHVAFVVSFFITGIVVYTAAPLGMNEYVSDQVGAAMNMVLSEDPNAIAQGEVIIRRYGRFVILDRIVLTYQSAKDGAIQQRLAKLYRDATGTDINVRIEVLDD
jgi:hypothetical protein